MSATVIRQNDELYLERGNNNACQTTNKALKERFCEANKADQFIFLYIDSLPLNIFKQVLKKDQIDNSLIYQMRNQGMTDSGPAFTSISVGRLSTKYEGTLQNQDNLFFQIIQAGFQVNAKAYAYPIEEMIGKDYFKDYENVEDIFNQGLCKDFIDTVSLYQNHNKNKNKLRKYFKMQRQEWNQKFRKNFENFQRILQNKTKELDLCLDSLFESKKISWFLYNVFSDKIGHEYTKRSSYYIYYIASIVANLEYFLDYLSRKQDLLVILVSDHGIVESYMQAEQFNHGVDHNENSSFVFFQKKDTKGLQLHNNMVINQVDLCSILSIFIKDYNIPINSQSNYKIKLNDNKEALNTLLQFKFSQIQKEIQYIKSFKKLSLNQNDQKEIEYFDEIFVSLSQEQNLQQKQMENIEIYYQKVKNISKLITEKAQFKIRAQQFFISLIITAIIMLPYYYQIIHWKKQLLRNKYQISALLSLIIFIIQIFTKNTLESYFQYISYLYLFILLIFAWNDTQGHKIAKAFIISIIGLKIYSIVVKYFWNQIMYYKNPIFQLIAILLYIYTQNRLTKKILPQGLKKFKHYPKIKIISFFFFIVMDTCNILYEILQIFAHGTKGQLILRTISFIFACTFILKASFIIFKKENWQQELFRAILTLVFWSTSNIVRIAVLLIIFWLFQELQKIQNQQAFSNKDKILIINLITVFAYATFKILQGNFDLNVLIRIGNKGFCTNLEECPIVTGALYGINKFAVFLIVYSLLIVCYCLQEKTRSKDVPFTKDPILYGAGIHFYCVQIVHLNCQVDFNQAWSSLLMTISCIFLVSVSFVLFLKRKLENFSKSSI